MIQSNTVENIRVYSDLREHLDKLPIGYPPTDSGIELEILKYLYSPLEAKIATKLKMIPETINHIYRRVKKQIDSKEKLAEILEKMAKNGVIYGKTRGKRNYYSNAMFIIGIYEYQVKRITRKFMELMHKYIDEAFANEYNKAKINQVRTIPVEKSIALTKDVFTYDNLRKLVNKTKGRIGVADCICRKGHDLLEKSCKLTDLRESCLTFRKAAKYYIDQGFARQITKHEALKILKKAEEAGLVLQPGNSKRLDFICTCCSCCCEGIKLAKKYPRPTELYSSSYYAEVDEKNCKGCIICSNQCQMEAIKVEEKIASINLNYCIGCGLCVIKCPSNAIKLKKKQNRKAPPKGHFRLLIKITKEKSGYWGAFKLIMKTISSMKLYYIFKKK